jgi:hypothetical protein
VGAIEKIALLIFFDERKYITSFDKVEALYNFINIDDIKYIKQKLN